MDSSGGRLVEVGQVLRVPPAHYLYGSDVLTLRVTGIEVEPDRFRALEWVGVRGVEIGSDGSDGEPREVLVRASALRDREGVTPSPAGVGGPVGLESRAVEITPAALMAGASVPPGAAFCLRRCGWTPPTGVDIADAAGAHTADTSHPTIFNRVTSALTDDGDGSRTTDDQAKP